MDHRMTKPKPPKGSNRSKRQRPLTLVKILQ